LTHARVKKQDLEHSSEKSFLHSTMDETPAVIEGPINVWPFGQASKPKALELYEQVHIGQYPNKEGTDIYYFPPGHEHYGYAIKFRRNPYKGCMFEEILYHVFRCNKVTNDSCGSDANSIGKMKRNKEGPAKQQETFQVESLVLMTSIIIVGAASVFSHVFGR